ncbi:UrcA family protein [Novosphingobium sp. 9]|uniref:UrcA family protein n=1 Tax=Novosphingobium sp. 9 TaxID=2025349 RepID=UPI0021B6A5A1|nr:UrcA family protein [Novosphingobium sp. 9]
MFKTQFAAAALSLALTGGLFAASTSAHANTTLVHYNDLDLTTYEGQHTLQQRLDKAALDVCQNARDAQGQKPAPWVWRACYVDTRVQVKQQAQTVIAAAADKNLPRLGG